MPIFSEIFPHGTSTITELDTKVTQQIQQGYDFEITHRWDGAPVVDHDPIRITMRWHFERLTGKPHKRVVRIHVKAPLFDDPEPSELPGPCPKLWNYECVELFFANERGHYLEVEVGPHGHWLVLFHRNYRDCFNTGDEVELEVKNTFQGDEWLCDFEIPLAYFPGGLTKFNAYALHGEADDRHYEALYAVTDGTFPEPDFHRLQFFGRIDSRRLIPEGYNRQPFNDLKYGDMWEEVTEKPKDE